MNGVQVWAKGLVAAFIGGGASAVSGGFALTMDDGKDFNTANPGHLLHIMGTMFLFSGIISAVAYLKQSPVPTEAGR